MAGLDFNSLDKSKGKKFEAKDFEPTLEKAAMAIKAATHDQVPIKYVLFSMEFYMSLSKTEAMTIYNTFKNLKVYFVNKEGWWLLDRFGDLTLTDIKKEV